MLVNSMDEDYKKGVLDCLKAFKKMLELHNVTDLQVYSVINEVRETIENDRFDELLAEARQAGISPIRQFRDSKARNS